MGLKTSFKVDTAVSSESVYFLKTQQYSYQKPGLDYKFAGKTD